MQIEFSPGGGSVTLVREAGDPKFFGMQGAKGEHALLHFLKVALNKQGNDLIKKRIQKDGHMMGDKYQPYLRTRGPRSKGRQVMIYSGFYAIRGANDDWNNDGEVTFCVTPTDWRKK